MRSANEKSQTAVLDSRPSYWTSLLDGVRRPAVQDGVLNSMMILIRASLEELLFFISRTFNSLRSESAVCFFDLAKQPLKLRVLAKRFNVLHDKLLESSNVMECFFL